MVETMKEIEKSTHSTIDAKGRSHVEQSSMRGNDACWQLLSRPICRRQEPLPHARRRTRIRRSKRQSKRLASWDILKSCD